MQLPNLSFRYLLGSLPLTFSAFSQASRFFRPLSPLSSNHIEVPNLHLVVRLVSIKKLT